MPQYTYPQDFTGTFWTITDGAYYVSTVGNDLSGDGSPKNPFLTIARAFELALTSEKIVIGPDEYVAFDDAALGRAGAELPCRVATTSNIPVETGGLMTIDGVLTNEGDRVLVWQQAGPAQNGIYLASSNEWKRGLNFNSSENITKGKLVPVLEGAEYGKSIFQLTTTEAINIDTTFLTFEKVAVTDWGEIKGAITNQKDLVSYVDLQSSYDMTVIVGPNEAETSPKNGSITVRTWLNSNPEKTGRVLILVGVYEENEINQHEVDIWAEDGAIVWSSATARSIFSDRHLGNDTILRVYGRGVFVHAFPTGSNDQQSINFRRTGSDVYVQAKKIDMAQMWHPGFQRLVVEDCDFIQRSEGSNRANCQILYKNCRFLNGIKVQEYNNSFSTIKLRDVEIIMSRKMGQEGIEIKDNSGNTVFTVDNSWLLGNNFLNITQQIIILNGSSGTGNVTIEGVDYALSFNSDLITTIDDFISTHETGLMATSDQLFIKRIAAITISGTSGGGVITIGGSDFAINYDTDLQNTAKKFFQDEDDNLDAIGIEVKNIGVQLIFTKNDGTRPLISFANTSGNLISTVDNNQFLIVSAQEVEFSVVYTSTSGNLGASVQDYYFLQELVDLILSQNNDRAGYAAINKNHFFIAGGADGRGQNIFLENVLIRLQKRKSVGIKMVPRVNEVEGKYGGLYANGLTIRDETGTGETVAIVQGYDSSAITSPFKAVLTGILHNCGSNTALIAGFDNMDITSNDPAYDTNTSIEEALIDKATPKGLLDCSTNPNYPVGAVGDYYYVPTGGAGKIGGASGDDVQDGDKIQCIIENNGGDQTTVGVNWIIFQGNLDKATTLEAQDGTDDEKYLTPQKGFEGWNSWIASKTVAALNTGDKTVIGAINELQNSPSLGAGIGLTVGGGNLNLGGFFSSNIFLNSNDDNSFSIGITDINAYFSSTLTLFNKSGAELAVRNDQDSSAAVVRTELLSNGPDAERGRVYMQSTLQDGSNDTTRRFEASPTQIFMLWDGDPGSGGIQQRITLDGLKMSVMDGNSQGLEYASDYSGAFTTRSLVDKAYVDNAVAGVGGGPFDQNNIKAAGDATIDVGTNGGEIIFESMETEAGKPIEDYFRRFQINGNVDESNVADWFLKYYADTDPSEGNYFTAEFRGDKIALISQGATSVGLELSSDGIQFFRNYLSSPQLDWQINSVTGLIIPSLKTSIPTSSSSPGIEGAVKVSAASDFLYICVADNDWRRVSLSTF